MGSIAVQTGLRAAPLLIGGGITASKTDPENLTSIGSGILSSLIGSPLSKFNLEEGEDKDENKGKVIDLEEKKKKIKDSDPDPDDEDSGDLITSIQQIEELVKENQKLEKEGDVSRRKENTKKIIFDKILPDNVLTTARQEINNRDGSKPFVKEDFRFIDKDGNSSFATEEQLAKIQKDFDALVGKITTLKKTGGMVDKAISYEPRY